MVVFVCAESALLMHKMKTVERKTACTISRAHAQSTVEHPTNVHIVQLRHALLSISEQDIQASSIYISVCRLWVCIVQCIETSPHQGWTCSFRRTVSTHFVRSPLSAISTSWSTQNSVHRMRLCVFECMADGVGPPQIHTSQHFCHSTAAEWRKALIKHWCYWCWWCCWRCCCFYSAGILYNMPERIFAQHNNKTMTWWTDFVRRIRIYNAISRRHVLDRIAIAI